MKTCVFFTLLMLLLAVSPGYAASCADTQNAASAAIRDRNTFAKDSINATMPDPEDTRGPFADCLDRINGIGGAFTLGISLPSLDQIIAGMCNQVDSMIQDKMHEALSEIRSTVNRIGRNNPFQVSVGGHGIGANISGKLK